MLSHPLPLSTPIQRLNLTKWPFLAEIQPLGLRPSSPGRNTTAVHVQHWCQDLFQQTRERR